MYSVIQVNRVTSLITLNHENLFLQLYQQFQYMSQQEEDNLSRSVQHYNAYKTLFVYRSRLQRDRERDISEKIALGMPNTGAGNQETMFDQRLFNTTKVQYN